MKTAHEIAKQFVISGNRVPVGAATLPAWLIQQMIKDYETQRRWKWVAVALAFVFFLTGCPEHDPWNNVTTSSHVNQAENVCASNGGVNRFRSFQRKKKDRIIAHCENGAYIDFEWNR